jgi:hypothetical protein
MCTHGHVFAKRFDECVDWGWGDNACNRALIDGCCVHGFKSLKIEKLSCFFGAKSSEGRTGVVRILMKGQGSKLYEKLVPKTYQKPHEKSREKQSKKGYHKPKSANTQLKIDSAKIRNSF